MDNVFKLPIIGRCYICGKPITEDELYAEITDGDDEICCEECWNEYLKRCENLLEQMKKEKFGGSVTMTVNEFVRRIQTKALMLSTGDIPIKFNDKDIECVIELIENGKGYYINIRSDEV